MTQTQPSLGRQEQMLAEVHCGSHPTVAHPFQQPISFAMREGPVRIHEFEMKP